MAHHHPIPFPIRLGQLHHYHPVEVSSGEVIRHRLSRAGDRQRNFCLHVIAMTQIRKATQSRTYQLRKRSTQKSQRSDALRETTPFRRRYRQLQRDATKGTPVNPGGHAGATTSSRAAG